MPIVRLFIFSFLLFFFVLSIAYSYITSKKGGEFLASVIEQKIAESSGIHAKLENFTVDLESFSGVLRDGENTFAFDGTYSFYPKLVEVSYKADVKNLKSYEKLLGVKIDAPLQTDGKAVKRGKEIEIKGDAKVFAGAATYTLNLYDFTPKSLEAEVDSFKIDTLLASLMIPKVALGNLSGKIATKIEDGKLRDGNFDFSTESAKFDKNLLSTRFDATTTGSEEFGCRIDGILSEKHNINLLCDGEIAQIVAKDVKSRDFQDIDLKADIVLKDLQYKTFKLNDKVKSTIKVLGDYQKLHFESKSDFFDAAVMAKTDIAFGKLRDLDIKTYDFDIKQILSYSDYPKLAKGTLRVDAQLEDLDSKNASGKFIVDSGDILIDSEELNKITNLAFPRDIPLVMQSKIDVSEGIGKGEVYIGNGNENITLSNLVIDFEKKETNFLYEALIKKFEMLNPTKERIKGSFGIDGAFSYGEVLECNGSSDDFGGEISFAMKDKNIKLQSSRLDMPKLLEKIGRDLPIESGEIEFSTHLVKDENISKTVGDVAIDAENLIIKGYDIDKIINSYKKSNELDLIDIGAFALAGPLGLAVTKGGDIGSLGGSAIIKGKSKINQLNADIKLEDGIAKLSDVAFRTDANRVALRGGVTLDGLAFEGFQVGLLDEEGCASYLQDVNGTVSNPEVATTTNILAMPFNIVGSAIKKGVETIAGKAECEVFYNGVVKSAELSKN